MELYTSFSYVYTPVVNKECVKCSAEFEITKEDLQFIADVAPVFGGQKFEIPPPTHCPDCRQRRRLAISNEWHFFPGKCEMCDKVMITEYNPREGRVIYCRECWHGDKWDARDYGQDFDFGRPFFEQFNEVRDRTPALALNTQGNNQNSEFIHYAGWSKNCYLIMHADFCEDCYYGYGFKKNLFCVDGFYNLHSELCYDCVDVHKCYGLIGCQDCQTCNSSAFLRDCIGCHDCFCCVGLRNQSFCFMNEKLSKEEYKTKMAEVEARGGLGSYKEYLKWREKLKELEKPHAFKEFHGNNLENCYGDYLNHCKDLHRCFDCEDVEWGRYCYQLVLGSKNCMDIYQFGTNLQQSYECSTCGENSYHLLFCDNTMMDSSDVYYSLYMEGSKNCFGCSGMMHHSYCVLNKQYTREEYDKLVPRIIEHMKKTGEWGEFFPSETAPHGYNKTTAQLYYPLTKEEALAQGFRWDDYEVPPPKVSKVLEAGDLPDNIADVGDDILDSAIQCEATGRLFRVTPKELAFYRRVGVPLPRKSWEQRHFDRFARRNPRKFWERKCGRDGCGCAISTTYSPDRPEKVYCEKCYMEELY